MNIPPSHRHIRRNRYLDLDFGLLLDLVCGRVDSVCSERYTFRPRDRLLLKRNDETPGQKRRENADGCCCSRPGTPCVHPRVSYKLMLRL